MFLTIGIATALARTPPPGLGTIPDLRGARDRLPARRPAHAAAAAHRLALRHHLRHVGDRPGDVLPARRAAAAPPRRRLAGRPDRRLAARLPDADDRHVVRVRPLLARHVQHPHGNPHDAVHAGTGVPGARRAGDAGAARAARRRQERTARPARVAARGRAVPRLAVLHPSGGRSRALRRVVLRPVLLRPLRSRPGEALGTPSDERPLPARGLPVLLGRSSASTRPRGGCRTWPSSAWCSPRCRSTPSSA